jgi:hypothetical protein
MGAICCSGLNDMGPYLGQLYTQHSGRFAGEQLEWQLMEFANSADTT